MSEYYLIYDADSSYVGATISFGSMLMGTACPASTLTHTTFGLKQEFIQLKERLNINLVTLHRDEMPEHMKKFVENRHPLPLMLKKKYSQYNVVFDAKELAAMEGSVEKFESALRSKGSRSYTPNKTSRESTRTSKDISARIASRGSSARSFGSGMKSKLSAVK